MKCILYIFLLIGLLAGSAYAQDLPCSPSSTITATTSADLQTALNLITTGGASQASSRVVCLTATTISLTSQVTWSVPDNIVLIGKGSLTSQGGGATTTTFVDTFASGNRTLEFTDIDAYFRFAGFKYSGPTGAGVKDNGVITFGGNTTLFRLDHFTFDAIGASDQSKWMGFGGCLYGLIDHAVWNLPNDLAWLHMVNGSCTDFMGNDRWPLATGFGGPNFLYMEDSQWLAAGSPTVSDTSVTDCHTSGKYVIRFNTVTAASIGQTHPTIHGGDDRGCRGHEIYGNTQRLAAGGDDPSFVLAASNSGPSLVWGNDIGTGNVERMIYINDCRQSTICGYTPTATPNNWGPCGTEFNGVGSNWDRNDDATTGRPCIDMPGRGQTQDLISGEFPNKINNRTGTIAWPIQALEPFYEWLNTGTPTNNYLTNLATTRIQANIDYYLYNTGTCVSGGACTAGVGSGATLPTTCTTSSEAGGGVGFWKTNEGSWNISVSNPYGVQQNGADGRLYKCTATNTWTLYYTPYTYPHPLQGVVSVLPSHFFFGPHVVFWILFFLLGGYGWSKFTGSIVNTEIESQQKVYHRYELDVN